MSAPNRAGAWGRPLYKSIVRTPLTPADFEYTPSIWERQTSRFTAPIELIVEQAIESADQIALDAVHGVIELLDELDGDPDLEPCQAGDDGCHYFMCGHRDGWGYLFDQSDGPVPVYGPDQSEGPIDAFGKPWSGYDTYAWSG